MSKSRDDEIYRKTVEEGQRGGLSDDFMEGMGFDRLIPGDEREREIARKGYAYGREHRFDSKGQRYHTSDNRGSNDPKEEREKESEESPEEESGETRFDSFSSGGNPRSYEGGGSYHYNNEEEHLVFVYDWRIWPAIILALFVLFLFFFGEYVFPIFSNLIPIGNNFSGVPV